MSLSNSKTDQYDVSARPDINKLNSKAIGLIGVLFLTVTGAAPITAMLLNTPIVVGFGNGFGAPAAFLVATIVLLIFSVGYAAMASKVSAVGGFYSFISHGLGREIGLGTGFAAVVAYAVFEPALAGGFAYFANLKIMELTGVNVPWPVLALVCIAGISILSYFDVEVSAKFLGIVLIAEVVILVVFAAAVFTHSGSEVVLNPAALNPAGAFAGFDAISLPDEKTLAAGAAGIGLFFAFWSWVGFEMAPNYAEEARDPKRVVPLSLYISVLTLGILYTLVSWAAVSAYGGDTVAMITTAQTDSANFFTKNAEILIGHWANDVMGWLVLTSAFACAMAFHNTASRYFYSLGREGILPSMLAKTHPTYKSPHIASFAQGIFAASIIVAFAVFLGSDDPNGQAYIAVYGLMALLGTILILASQALVSLAIIVYFRREHPEDHHWFKTLVAPLIAFFAQSYIIYLCVSNMEFLGAGLALSNWLVPIDIAVFVVGLLGAFYLKKSNPTKFEQIGRLVYTEK